MNRRGFIRMLASAAMVGAARTMPVPHVAGSVFAGAAGGGKTYRFDAGMRIEDWRYRVRLANLVPTLGFKSVTSEELRARYLEPNPILADLEWIEE